MSNTKVIDIANQINFVNDYNINNLTNGNNLVTINHNGILTLNSTQNSTDSITGALVLRNGGLSINNNVNATGTSQGGSLTIVGGGAFSQDVYIGGNLTVTGSIIYANASSARNTYAYLKLTATDNSINGSTGALVTVGGITIQANGNATSSTSGGGLTVSGGIATNQDIYVGGKANIPNIISTNISSGNVNFNNISSSTLNITSITSSSILSNTSTITNLLVTNVNAGNVNAGSLNAGSSNTIANIFTTNGNVGINTTNPSYILDINGNLRVNSNSLNTISGTTLTDVLQIENTNASGSSSLQFLNNSGSSIASFGVGNSNFTQFQNTAYLSTVSGVPIKFSAGGNISSAIVINAADNSMSITSTTASNSTSSGSLKVSGGAGISGNLYVGGGLYVNSQIAANITNTTTSSNSTTGAFLLSGGLSINILSTSYSNSTSTTSGGALTIAGGAAISQNVYIGGVLDIQSGSNNLNNINLQSIQIYSNSNNGAYSVIGSGNSSRTPNSFTPIRFTGWNDQTNPKLTINNFTIDIINSINAVNNSNTIGTLFTTAGNIGIGTTQPGFNLDVAGNINFSGSLYKNSTLYTSSQWIGTNGSLLTYGSTGSSALVGINISNPSFTLDVDGISRISISLTTGSIYSTNQTTTNQVGTNITTLNLLSTNSSLGIINSTGLTTGNINFTGNLYQNGISYIGSQWITSSGNLTYTSGTVIVSGLISSTNLQTVNLTAGTLNIINGLTTSNINFTGNLYQNGSAYTASQWSGTSGSLLYYGTTGNIFVGIGTSNPTYTLTVNGIVSATGLAISGTTNSLNSTTGQYIFNSVSISSTQDVSSYTQGGSLTIGGGVSFGKSIAIAGSVNYSGVATDIAGSFNASNNIMILSNITGLLFPTSNIRSFTLTISIQISATTSLYAQYIIEGIQNASGWFISDSYIGDNTGVLFSITNTGQIQYTSTNISGWSSTTFNYRSSAYSISANYIQTAPPTSGNYTVTGNLAIQSTTDALSASQGSIVTNGGIFVTKSINVGSGIVNNNVSVTNAGTFIAANGQTVPSNITGLILTSSTYNSFTIVITVILLRNSGGNYRAQYTLEGIQKDSGWVIYTTSFGDTIDLTFSITSSGQLQYSSNTTYTNFASLTFNYNLTAFYVTGGFNPISLPGGSNSINTINITSVQDVTNSTTAALIVAGGAAINLNLLVGAGITSGNINSIGLTTGNINFTGNLYQNGIPYSSSQWNGVAGSSLSYTSGTVSITNLSVGNFIMGDSKKYIYSGSIPNTTNGNLVLSFNTLNSYFYAKIICALQETSNLQNISILQFECSAAGGTTSSIPSIWNIGVNQPSGNNYIWNTNVISNSSNTSANLQFAPFTSLRNYTYTLQIDLVGTAKAATLIQDNVQVNTWSY